MIYNALLKYLKYIVILIVLASVSCKETKKESKATLAPEPDTEILASTKLNDSIITPTSYPNGADISLEDLRKNYQGIWGDYGFLDSLNKYNSLSKAFDACQELILEMQVREQDVFLNILESEMMLVLEGEFYVSIKAIDEQTLLFVNNNAIDKKHLRVLSKIPFDENLVTLFLEDPLSNYALSKMKNMWFAGRYEMVDKSGKKTGTLVFDELGEVKGYNNAENVYYYFDNDSDNEYDSMLLFGLDGDNGFRYLNNLEHLLMEYKNNSFAFYTVEYESEDMPKFPLVKKDFKFSLKKEN